MIEPVTLDELAGLQAQLAAAGTAMEALLGPLTGIVPPPSVTPPVITPPVITVPPASGTDGTTLTGPTGQLTDKSGAVWTLGKQVPNVPGINSYVILRDGKRPYRGGVAAKLATYLGVVWAYAPTPNPPWPDMALSENDPIPAQWWFDNGSTWAFSHVSPTGAPPSSLSPDGTVITGPTADKLTDGKGDLWSLGDPAPYGFAILKNGAPLASSSGVKLEMMSGGVWTLNNVGGWFQYDGKGGWIASFYPPQPTPPPPQPIVLPPLDDTIPQRCIDAGVTTLAWEVYFDDLSRIDIYNKGTLTADTDLWVADPYKGQPGEADYGALVIPPEYLWTTMDGVLVIKKSADGAYFNNNQPTLASNWYPGTLGSADANNPNISQNHGRFVKGNCLMEIECAFNQHIASGGAGFPAYWAVNWWSQNKGPPWYTVEIDIFEFFPVLRFNGEPLDQGYSGAFGFNCGDMATGVTTYPPNVAFPQPHMSELGNPVLDCNTFFKSSVLHATIGNPINKPGKGTLNRFFNNKEFVPNRMEYCLDGPPTYPGSAPNGTFSPTENIKNSPDYLGYPIFITCGNRMPGDTSWPLYVRRVRWFVRDINDFVVVEKKATIA